jgi:hypothetical protein
VPIDHLADVRAEKVERSISRDTPFIGPDRAPPIMVAPGSATRGSGRCQFAVPFHHTGTKSRASWVRSGSALVCAYRSRGDVHTSENG